MTPHIGAAGGTIRVTLQVTRGSDCTWTALPVGLFLTILGKAEGVGDDVVTIGVAENRGPARTGTAVIAGATVTVSQDAGDPANCIFDVTPRYTTTGVGGGTVTFTVKVTQGSNCAWTAGQVGPGVAPDLTVISGASGMGDGAVLVSAGPNRGVARYESLLIAGQLVTVGQPELVGACEFNAAPLSFSVSAAAQTVAFDVAITKGTPEDCQWSAATLDETVVSVLSLTPTSPTTRHVVTTVKQNPGGERKGYVFINPANITIVVTQAAAR